MRLVFFLLLLANVLLFAWTRVGTELAMSESFLLSQQINPDAIRLLDPREVGQLAAKKPELKGLACLEWGALSTADLERAKTVLAVFSEGAKISERRMEESAAYWVYMPPRATRQDAQVKAAELKRLGIDEFFIVQDEGKFRFAISLGVFRTADAARAYLDTLRNKGIRTAVVGPRDTQVTKVYLQMRGLPETASARLPELRTGFPGTDVRDCPSEEKKG